MSLLRSTFLLFFYLSLGLSYSAAQSPASGTDGFLCLQEMSDAWSFDMRYATDNNFLDTAVYPCDRCYLREEVALRLQEANDSLRKLGLQLHFFDCYRPVAVQKHMWEILPDARYVANPYGNGSSHNRGAAVDLTLARLDGQLLDMGTDHDFFGERAHHAYNQLSEQVLANRRLLKSIMEAFQFRSIKTEWWHYSYIPRSYPIIDFPVCGEQK